MSVVGIDFGNINCTIAAAQKGGVDVLLNETSSRQTPAMVSFGEKERYLGEAANAQYMRNIKNTVTSIKRLIGHKWGEKEIQEEIKNLPLKTVELPNHDVGVEVLYAGEVKRFSIVSIAAMLLQKLKLTAEAALTGRQCKDVVISVPGFWTDQQRRALLNAAQIANLNCLRLINDNTATALSYGIYKTNLSETEPIYVMFVDMGHSSTSVSVVEFLKGKLKVLSSAYDRNLGGKNFDELLVKHFVKEFKEKFKIDISTNPRALIRLEVACEKLKKILNTNPEAPINIECIMDEKDVHGTMTKENFEALAKPLAAKVLEPVKQALADSGIPAEKLFAVEIVGGASRLSVVKAGLAEFFKRDINQTLNAEEAVAKGCALMCAMLSPLFKVREFSITDIVSYPIKVSWKTPGVDAMNTDDVLEVFPKNNPLPSSKLLTFHRADPVEIIAEYAQPQLLPEGASTVIGKFIIPEVPHKEGENAKIKVKVKVDLHGIFVVESAQAIETVEEQEPTPAPAATEKPKDGSGPTPMEQEPTAEKPKEGETPASPATPTSPNAEAKPAEKKKKVKRVDLKLNELTSGLSEKEIMEMIEEENRMAVADRVAIETAEQKNAVESYVYDMRNKLHDSLAPFTTEQAREQFSKVLSDTEDWLYGEGEDVAKSAYAKKLEELRALGEPIKKRKYEDENRYEAVMQLRGSVQTFILTAESEDPKYDHIEKSEKQKIVDEAKKIENWLNTEMAKQDKLPKHADPVITVTDINKKKTELEKFANPILNKPKPKPKEEPKKEEPKKEEAKPAEGEKKENAQQQTPPTSNTGDAQSKPTQPNVDMDLD